jgi:peptide/nickel transport system substrate-binding protein
VRYNQKMSTKQLLKVIFSLVLGLALPWTKLIAEPLSVAISSTPTNLSPYRATDANSQNINRLTYLSLVDVDRSMKIVCRACTKFEESIVEGTHRIRFRLRDDLSFHDGQKITSADVRSSWLNFIAEENGSLFRNAFRKIQSIELHSPLELTLTYESYSSDNLSNLVLLKISKAQIEEKQLVGSGPYQLIEESQFEISLVPVENHFENTGLRPLSFKVVRDETTLALKLIKGEIELVTSQMSPRKEKWLTQRGNPRIHVYRAPSVNFIYLGINHRSTKFGDFNVRKAIAHALPVDKIIKYKLNETVVKASGMYSEAFSELYLGEAEVNYNVEKAKKYLRAAGYDYSEVVKAWVKKGERLVIDWKVTNNRATIEIVEIFRHYLGQLGIQLNITIQEWGTFSRSLRQGNFDIVMSQWIGFTGPEMLGNVFHSSRIPPNGANRGAFEDSLFDGYFDRAESATSEQERQKYFRKAHERAINQLAYIPLWHPDIRWISRNCEVGVVPYPTGSFLALLDLKSSCETND